MNPSFRSHGVVLVLNSTVLTSSNWIGPKIILKESGRLCEGAEEKDVSNRKNGDRNHLLSSIE